jgi:hypothetical protein
MILISNIAKFLGRTPFTLRRSMERNGIQVHETRAGFAISQEDLLSFLQAFQSSDLQVMERVRTLGEMVSAGVDWTTPENMVLPDGVTPDYTGNTSYTAPTTPDAPDYTSYTRNTAPDTPDAPTTPHRTTPTTPSTPDAPHRATPHRTGNTGRHRPFTSSDLLSNSWVLFFMALGAIALQAYVFEIAIVKTLQEVGHTINSYQAYAWAILMEMVGLLIAVNMKGNQNQARWFWLCLFFGSQLLMDMSIAGIIPFAVAKMVVSYSLPVVILACSHLYLKNEKLKWIE